MTLGDQIAAEQLYEQRKLGWRYTALHYEGGSDLPFPERIVLPGMEDEVSGSDEPTWADVEDVSDLMSPKVLALMKGG
ncbi:hypothetical protein [Mycolicibacterium mageritense]|uniref:hypothetical protein n=1 Tax=Mycolicibacterium mageritense TaxID=53462 RepID=UPI001E5D854E|nr:hypothetical protein [Mycolicibacterium mageritense]MCC9182565.1 hypothetical protein [Mycolicibacterium mageritense]